MKKFLSLLLVLFLYALAFTAAVGSYIGLSRLISNRIALFLLADVAATIVIWISSLITKNSSMYDPYWSVQPPVILCGLLYIRGGELTAADCLALVAVFVWATRLTANWIAGWGGLKHEDWRYAAYRRNLSPVLFHITNFGGIMMMPTLIVFFNCVPLFYLVTEGANTAAGFAGCALCLAAALLQLASDEQMRAFRSVNKDKDAVMSTGLWKYSRHPNYLGEVMMWWGVYIMCAGSAPLWAVICPVSMTVLFVFISVPLMDKKLMAKSGFADYKARTSSLLLLPPKKQKP